MPLSEDEQRILGEIEANLRASDPALVRQVASTAVYTALARMRESGNQLAIVLDQGRMIGVVTLTDVLQKLFPGTDGY